MRDHVLALALVGGAVAVGPAVVAQTPGGDEAAIRAAIAQLPSTDLRTADSIFFSGAYIRPFIRGQGTPEPVTRARGIAPGSQRVQARVRRIDVSASGDMAYEFSDATNTRRVKRPDGREESETFENSTLRVWKKVNGRWLVAAHFSARHEDRQ